jgi:hypothetical protein
VEQFLRAGEDWGEQEAGRQRKRAMFDDILGEGSQGGGDGMAAGSKKKKQNKEKEKEKEKKMVKGEAAEGETTKPAAAQLDFMQRLGFGGKASAVAKAGAGGAGGDEIEELFGDGEDGNTEDASTSEKKKRANGKSTDAAEGAAPPPTGPPVVDSIHIGKKGRKGKDGAKPQKKKRDRAEAAARLAAALAAPAPKTGKKKHGFKFGAKG